MKIAHINMFYYPTFGGVEQVMQELAEKQAEQGHEVHVFCCDSDKNKRIKEKYEIHNKVHIHRSRYWFRLSTSTFIWPGLILQLPRYDFDIIHTHVSGHAYVLIAGIVARLKGIKHVHTTHCHWTDKYRPWILNPFLFLNNLIFNRISFSLIDKIIAITPWELPILRKWADESKIGVIPNGTDKIFFKRIYKNNFKKKLGIKGRLVLFFGRLNVTKGPDMFVLAAKEILKERKDITFLIRGPDEGMKETVKQLIGKEKKIILLSSTRDKKDIVSMYQSADVYVLPSYREGLPLTIFEAFASGLPVVASPVNGVPYEMKDKTNGFFVDYGDIKNLKDKILLILDNKVLAKKITRNNIQHAKNYDWDIINKNYMKTYNETTADII